MAVLRLVLWIALSLPAFGGEISGPWITEDGEARVEIGRCEAGYCGRITWLAKPDGEDGRPWMDIHNPDPDLRGRAVLGLRILVLAAPDDRGTYRGRIYDPKNGKTYRCKVRLPESGGLKLRGYVGISLLGRTSRWTRSDRDPRGGRALTKP